jgi:hypothetical protein
MLRIFWNEHAILVDFLLQLIFKRMQFLMPFCAQSFVNAVINKDMKACMKEWTKFFKTNNVSAVKYKTKMKISKSVYIPLVLKTSYTTVLGILFEHSVLNHVISHFRHH